MLSILSLQVHKYLYSTNYCKEILSTNPLRPFPLPNKEKKMSLRNISYTLLVALLAIMASAVFISPNLSLLHQLIELGLATFSSPFIATFIPYSIGGRRHHHHHNKHPSDGKIVNICEDFPPDFPPPDTNTTSTICVDRNGCCNFTTVQSAVDSVMNFSQKRTIIWINSGIY